jgi:hypothetical protein
LNRDEAEVWSHRRRRVDDGKVRLRFGRLEGVTPDRVTACRCEEKFIGLAGIREQAVKSGRGPGAISGDDRSMAKELRTAAQLSDMIVSALGVRELDIEIRRDHAYGWQPTVISSPGDLIGYQRRVEDIANRLRFQFALRE